LQELGTLQGAAQLPSDCPAYNSGCCQIAQRTALAVGGGGGGGGWGSGGSCLMFSPMSILKGIGNDRNADGVHVLADLPYPHAMNILAGPRQGTSCYSQPPVDSIFSQPTAHLHPSLSSNHVSRGVCPPVPLLPLPSSLIVALALAFALPGNHHPTITPPQSSLQGQQRPLLLPPSRPADQPLLPLAAWWLF
jgi:hypothetical protein